MRTLSLITTCVAAAAAAEFGEGDDFYTLDSHYDETNNEIVIVTT